MISKKKYDYSFKKNKIGVFALIMRPDYFILSIKELAFKRATSNEPTRIYLHES
jgi:hypothetical protein